MRRRRSEERVILIRLKTKRPKTISVMLLQRRLNVKREKRRCHLQKIKKAGAVKGYVPLLKHIKLYTTIFILFFLLLILIPPFKHFPGFDML